MRIDIELSTYCNAKCELCKRHYDYDKVKSILNKNIDFELLSNFIIENKDFEYTFSGLLGDPFMYDKLNELFILLKDNKVKSEFHTNFDFDISKVKNNLNYLLENNLAKIFVALDSLKNNKYRKTSTKNILNNLKLLIDKNVILKVIVFDFNESEIDNIKTFAKNKYQLYFVHSHTYNENLKAPRDFNNYHKVFEGCRFNISINVDGTVIPCCFAIDDYKLNNKDSLMFYKNKDKLNIKNDLNDIMSNEYITLYKNKKAIMCKKCGYK